MTLVHKIQVHQGVEMRQVGYTISRIPFGMAAHSVERWFRQKGRDLVCRLSS